MRLTCVTGHEITDAASETEVSTLDAGAEIRLCRMHGTVVAIERVDTNHLTEASDALDI
ncbi:MAG TPA: hypothetical protein VFB34_02685 [Chloroflexota bacterium]|nr:hypothetical protein [Chloroflexota bacterium]